MFSDSMGSENALSLTQAFLGGFNAARQSPGMAPPIFPAAVLLAGRSPQQTKPRSGKSFGAAQLRCNVIQNIPLRGAAMNSPRCRLRSGEGEILMARR